MKIKKNDIKYFIKLEEQVYTRESILSFLLLMLIVGIPTAVFGLYSNVTSLVMIPIMCVMCVWSFFLWRNPTNYNQFNLYTGIIALFLSFSSLILAYRYLLSSGQQVSPKTLILVLGIYCICIFTNIMISIRFIHKGYYKQEKKYRQHSQVEHLIPIIGVVLVVSGRTVFARLDQNLLDYLIIIFLLISAFLLIFLIMNIFRYYLAITVKD